MEDLEIRGAGNLFGTDQSGNIYDVGVEFYLDLLDSEIRKINNSIIFKSVELNNSDLENSIIGSNSKFEGSGSEIFLGDNSKSINNEV